MVPFGSLVMVSITMAVSCIIAETKRDIGRKKAISILPTFDAPVGGPHQNTAIRFGTEKIEWWVYQTVKKLENMFALFDTIHERESHTPHRPRLCIASRGKNYTGGAMARCSKRSICLTCHTVPECVCWTDGQINRIASSVYLMSLGLCVSFIIIIAYCLIAYWLLL